MARLPTRAWISGTVLLLGLPIAYPSFAQAPAAIVEEVNSRSAGVELMDYVSPGKSIRLQSGDTLVLGYLRSCWRESIAGGVVSVGEEQSKVEGGKVTRTKERCDGGRTQLTSEEAKKSGAMAFRRVTPGTGVTIYGRSPVFELPGAGRLLIERLDAPGERKIVEVKADELVRGAFLDTSKSGITLGAGGRYRASFGDKQTLFSIAPTAEGGATPLLGRLVRFETAR
jgi:hypothetical protein